MRTVRRFKARLARRIPDPVLGAGCELHILVCRITDLPKDVPLFNVRDTEDIDRGIYAEIASYLLGQLGDPGLFYHMNVGITILAQDVTKRADIYDVRFTNPQQGIVNGGHSYDICLENQEELRELEQSDSDRRVQYVKVFVITGFPVDAVSDVVMGLNTSMAVSQMALANFEHKFDWIADCIRGEPYFDDVAFTQGQKREVDLREILRILYIFNVHAFPNEGARVPKLSYTGRDQVLAAYLKDPKPFMKLSPILKDILRLYDMVQCEAVTLWNAGKQNAKGGALSFIEGGGRSRAKSKKRPEKKPDPNRFYFPFLQKRGPYRLARAMRYPLVGAFRWMARINTDGTVRWKTSFDDVVSLWRDMAIELLELTKQTCEEHHYNLNTAGKSTSLWTTLHRSVGMRAMS